jgi:thiamine-phosphate pyrophosphorylase
VKGGSFAAQLPLPAVCLVSDRRLCGEGRFVEVVAAAVDGGVNVLQLREKDLGARELLALGERLKPVLEGRCLLVVNDRLDVALALDSDGVQLGAGSLPVGAARHAGWQRLIGRSVHSDTEAAAAKHAGADFVVLGTIFATRSHPGKEPAGAGLIARARTITTLPVIAIGGINRDNAAAVMAAGADGIAVISAILAAPDPAQAAAELAAAVRADWRLSEKGRYG